MVGSFSEEANDMRGHAMSLNSKRVEFSHHRNGMDFTEAWEIYTEGGLLHFEVVHFRGREHEHYWMRYRSWLADLRAGRQPIVGDNEDFHIERRSGKGTLRDTAALLLKDRDHDPRWRDRVWNTLSCFADGLRSLEEVLACER